MKGTHFRRQMPIGRFVVDFACPAAHLVVEVDGSQHGDNSTRVFDEQRTRWLESEGYQVLRFWNNEVTQNLRGVLQRIYVALYGSAGIDARELKHTRRRRSGALTHPGALRAPTLPLQGRVNSTTAFCYKGPMRIIGLAGWSGSGKTTLITKLIPRLIARGIKVSTLKHAHHGFDLDQPGKDSFFHRAAGATEVIISSAKRWAILHELRDEPEWDLRALVAKMSPVDLVLVEGFKRDAFPKLEIHRAANGKPLIHPEDPHIVAIASDIALPQAKVPVIDLNDTDAIADLLLRRAVAVGTAEATAAARSR
jgi:molybdopterin-guanine dinucleotide biosynthesis protein B